MADEAIASPDPELKEPAQLTTDDANFFDELENALEEANPVDDMYGADESLINDLDPLNNEEKPDGEQEEEEPELDAKGNPLDASSAPKTGDNATGDAPKTGTEDAKETGKLFGDKLDKHPDQTKKEENGEEVKLDDEELLAISGSTKLSRGDLQKLFAPIKAGGKNIQLNSVEEVLKMVQFGADYYSKTQDLSGDKKLVETLKQNNLTQQDINFYMDLKNKDPEAIKKLLKESELDIYDDTFDLDAATKYEQKDYSANMVDVAFNQTVQDLSSTPKYDTLMQEVKQMDETSVARIYENPNMLRILSSQVESGMYDAVAGEVMKQRAMGNISSDTPFLESYKDLGQQMESSGLLASFIGTTDNNQAKTQANAGATKITAAQQAANNNSKQQFKNKSGSRNTAKPKIDSLLELDELSDEEFKKKFGF